MREIKFRAWDSEHKIIKRPSVNMLIDSYSGHCYWQFGFEMEPMGNLILMQYTGLKDKNGREIYEGDIVKYPYGYAERIDEVIFDEGGMFYLIPIKNPLYYQAWPQDGSQKCEIIGNIYENPELLKEEHDKAK